MKKVRTPRNGNVPGRGPGKCRGPDDHEKQEEAYVLTLQRAEDRGGNKGTGHAI